MGSRHAQSVRHLDRRFAPAGSVADAVCYEGYVLYPYRALAAKNQFRWQWGVLVPPGMEDRSAERSLLRTELVAEVRPGAQVHVRVRGLHVQARSVLALVDGEDVAVQTLETGTAVWTSFDEAVPWQVDLAALDVDGTTALAYGESHVLPGGTFAEAIADPDGTPRGRLVRDRHPVAARVGVEVTPLDALGPSDLAGRLVRLGVTVANVTDWADLDACRDDVLRRSIVSAHVLVLVDRGRLVSSLDPPSQAADAVAGCHSEGLFPVLVGTSDDLALASPIVLYDRPAVAPESGGDMFDATEIDEILALRVRTLTEQEKREARGTDARAAGVVGRCDAMDAQTLGALHGTFRPIDEHRSNESAGPAVTTLPAFWQEDAEFDPWSDTVVIEGAVVGAGARVRLRPRRHADAQDLFVDGRTALVAGVFHDDGGEIYLAVSLEDPDTDLQAWHGRYLYFAPEEVELLARADAATAPYADCTSSLPTDFAGPPSARANSADDIAPPRVLVAGVGNIFLGDDGFGVEVVNRIDPGALPTGVKVADFGIRGIHLAYELLDGYDVLVLVDAVSRGASPGTLSLIEHPPDGNADGGTLAAMDAHGMDPASVLAMTADMGGSVGRVLVLGCEASTVADGIGLSDPVEGAIPAAIDALHELISSLARADDHPPRPVSQSMEVLS